MLPFCHTYKEHPRSGQGDVSIWRRRLTPIIQVRLYNGGPIHGNTMLILKRVQTTKGSPDKYILFSRYAYYIMNVKLFISQMNMHFYLLCCFMEWITTQIFESKYESVGSEVFFVVVIIWLPLNIQNYRQTSTKTPWNLLVWFFSKHDKTVRKSINSFSGKHILKSQSYEHNTI